MKVSEQYSTVSLVVFVVPIFFPWVTGKSGYTFEFSKTYSMEDLSMADVWLRFLVVIGWVALDADGGGLVLRADDLPEGELHFEGVSPVVGADAGVVFPFHADGSAGGAHGDEGFGEEFDDEFFGEVVGEVEAGRLPFGVVGFGDFGIIEEGF